MDEAGYFEYMAAEENDNEMNNIIFDDDNDEMNGDLLDGDRIRRGEVENEYELVSNSFGPFFFCI